MKAYFFIRNVSIAFSEHDLIIVVRLVTVPSAGRDLFYATNGTDPVERQNITWQSTYDTLSFIVFLKIQ